MIGDNIGPGAVIMQSSLKNKHGNGMTLGYNAGRKNVFISILLGKMPEEKAMALTQADLEKTMNAMGWYYKG